MAVTSGTWSGGHGVDDDRAVAGLDDAYLEQVGGGVGADEHREAVVEVVDEDRIVKAWIMSVSGMPCLRALGAMSGASTFTS